MDFTLKKYKQLLEILIAKGYQFARFDEFLIGNAEFRIHNSKLLILRHDVDLLPENSLAMANIENALGIKGTYYFRIVPDSFDEKIIKKIAGSGHEIGYHYEEVDFARQQINGRWSMFDGKYKKSSTAAIEKLKNDASTPLSMTKPQSNNDASTPLSMTIDLAYEMFKVNLEKIRKVVPVTTICMHGSPFSPYDNKEIWFDRDASGKQYDYKDLGIIGEPYFDIDWNEFGYLTDTGRCWNGSDVSVRDKVESKFKFNFKSTRDIIANIDRLPDHIMITVHPQRWTDSYYAWGKELVWQNFKNVVKRFIMMNDD